MSLEPDPAAEPRPTKRPRGRPRIFDEQRRHTLLGMISVGLSRNEACRHVGVPPSSVVHAARTDPDFAQQLQQALFDRANRPPELADIGSRSWRAYARRLEALSPHFRLPSTRRQYFADRRLRRMIKRIVLKLLSDPQIGRRALAPGSTDHASAFDPLADYCFKTPMVSAPAQYKNNNLHPPVGLLFQTPPFFPHLTETKTKTHFLNAASVQAG
jgi:hypothetical protein